MWKFFIKSAYQVTNEWTVATSIHLSGSLSAAGPLPLWTALWNVNVPRKVRVYFWRICRNIVLTKSNLASKHIANDMLCPLCNSQGESTSHIIYDCHFARCAWLSSFLGYLPQLAGYTSFYEWALDLVTSFPTVKFELMMVTS